MHYPSQLFKTHEHVELTENETFYEKQYKFYYANITKIVGIQFFGT